MEFISVLILSLITFLSRLFHLTQIPIFTDEAIYIRWAQIGLNDPAHRYISLTDGKQPLMTWLMYPALKIFSDPLFAGRFVSVLAGTAAVLGIYMATRELFGRKAAFFAGIIYLISPFAFNYDRLALMDSLLASLGIWCLFLSVVLIKKVRLDIALILGIVGGFGLLTKSSAQFFFYCLPFSLLLFNWKQKNAGRLLLNWIAYCSIAFMIAQTMYNSLRLSPWFYIINQKNLVFIYSFSEFFRAPFAVLFGNLIGLTTILVSYLTIPMVIAILGGLVLMFVKREKKILMLFLWFLFPYMALAAFGMIIYPRFILFMVYPLFIIAAYTLGTLFNFFLKKNKLGLLVIPAVLGISLVQSILLAVNPVMADIPDSDRKQLFLDWPSGYGVKEVVSFIEDKARSGKVVLGTEGTFGLNPAAYEIYLGNNKNVEIRGYWPVSEVPKDLLEASKKYPTYLVFKEKQEIPISWPLKLIAKHQKGDSQIYLSFYRVDNSEK